MEVTKTVRVPVYYGLTKRKLSILEHLTARLTYCVRLFSNLIEEKRMNVSGYGQFKQSDIAQIKAQTKLRTVHLQQCRDQALWIWRSYRAQHAEWAKEVKHAKGKWHEKLLKREPQKPFHDCLNHKIPVRIDIRSGTVERSERIRISPYVLRLSTIKKRHRVTIPLNPSKYHVDLLERARIVDFQLVKRSGWYYAHICIKYDVLDRPTDAVLGVDLGVRRAMAAVLLRPNGPIRRGNLSILQDGEKRHRMDQLNRRVVELQQANKWTVLKCLRHRRRNVAAYYDRLIAIRIAKMAEQKASMVAVGYPRGMKYVNYHGNGKRGLRRMLQQRFSYRRRVQYILEECAERGVRAETVHEAWTSRRCHRCGSMHALRPVQSEFWCLDCGMEYNADLNAAINIGSVLLAVPLSRGATEGLAHAGDELAQEPASPEARKEELPSACQL